MEHVFASSPLRVSLVAGLDELPIVLNMHQPKPKCTLCRIAWSIRRLYVTTAPASMRPPKHHEGLRKAAARSLVSMVLSIADMHDCDESIPVYEMEGYRNRSRIESHKLINSCGRH